MKPKKTLPDTSQAEKWIDSNTFLYQEKLYEVEATGKVVLYQSARRKYRRGIQMGTEPTASEKTIWNIKEKASLLEQERKKAYESRLQEVVIEITTWGLSPEQYPMTLAEYAFKLGKEFGSNKMYEYL